MSTNNLTNKEIDKLDALVNELLDRLEQGIHTKNQVRGIVTHLVLAADQGNLEELRHWLEKGQELIRQPPYTEIQ